MTKLIVTSVDEALYRYHQAAVFISYGTKEIPKDNEDMTLGQNHPDPFAFRDYLEKNVLPTVKQGLKNSLYEATEVDVLQGSPPYVIVQRKDHLSITKQEREQIKQLVTNIIELKVYNNPNHLHHHQSQQPSQAPSIHSMALRRRG